MLIDRVHYNRYGTKESIVSPKPFGFQGDVIFSQNADGKTFTVRKDFIFITKSGKIIKIKDGFVTDLASIPSIFWTILPPFGTYTDPAIVHDWLYNHKGILNTTQGEYPPLTLIKSECDNIFLEGMIDTNTSIWKRDILYTGVKFGGYIAWHKKRPVVMIAPSNYSIAKLI